MTDQNKFLLILTSILALFVSVIGYELQQYRTGDKYTDAVDKVILSTVAVNITTKNPEHLQAAQQRGLLGHGTGIIFKHDNKDVYVVTNYHVIEKAITLPDYISIKINAPLNTYEYDTTIVGYDKVTDVAVLKYETLENEEIKPLKFAKNTQDIKHGTEVISVGHGLGLFWSASKGTINGKNRLQLMPLVMMLQHDAVINKGHSGGPLTDLNGNILGINTMILAPDKSTWAGVSMAVPAWQVERSIRHILKSGQVLYPEYDWTMENVGLEHIVETQKYFKNRDERSFARIKDIEPDSPSFKAGLKVGDYITEIDGEDALHIIQIIQRILKKDPWQEIIITVVRDGKTIKIPYQLQRLDLEGITPTVVPLKEE